MKKVIGRKAEWLVGNGLITILKSRPKEIILRYALSGATHVVAEGNIIFEGNLEKCILLTGVSNSKKYIGIYVYKGSSQYGLWRTPFMDNTDDVYNLTFGEWIKCNDVDFVGNSGWAPIPIDELVFEKFNLYNIDNVIYRYNSLVFNNFSLTPIQLTSSLPAYLASDNKPHSAGECGMWDSVSEKFYGNANTSGEFTVENELDEYVEVDLTGIAINGKYQRVSVENTEIQQIMYNGKEVRALMLNGKIVYKKAVETYSWLYLRNAYLQLGVDNLDIAVIREVSSDGDGQYNTGVRLYLSGNNIGTTYDNFTHMVIAYYNLGGSSSNGKKIANNRGDINTIIYNKLEHTITFIKNGIETIFSDIEFHDYSCSLEVGYYNRSIKISEVEITLQNGNKMLLKPAIDLGQKGLYDTINKIFYPVVGGTAEVYN